MINKHPIIYLISVLFIGFFVMYLISDSAYADTSPPPVPTSTPTISSEKHNSVLEVINKNELVLPNYTPINSWEDLGVIIMNWMLGVAGTLLVLVILIGGIMYITSAGEESQAEKAKKIVTGGIIGIAVIAATWGVFNFILYYWGS